MPPNRARGEISARLGGRSLRLCVTLRGLAALEGHFGVSGFDALAERLKRPGAGDVMAMLDALCLDEIDVARLDIGLKDAIGAVVAAFEAMHD